MKSIRLNLLKCYKLITLIIQIDNNIVPIICILYNGVPIKEHQNSGNNKQER